MDHKSHNCSVPLKPRTVADILRDVHRDLVALLAPAHRIAFESAEIKKIDDTARFFDALRSELGR